MKIFIQSICDDYCQLDLVMIAAHSLEEAKLVAAGGHTKDEYVEAYLKQHDPRNYRDYYKTEAGWKQAIYQFDTINKEKHIKCAIDEYLMQTSDIYETSVETEAETPSILWKK